LLIEINSTKIQQIIYLENFLLFLSG